MEASCAKDKNSTGGSDQRATQSVLYKRPPDASRKSRKQGKKVVAVTRWTAGLFQQRFCYGLQAPPSSWQSPPLGPVVPQINYVLNREVLPFVCPEQFPWVTPLF